MNILKWRELQAEMNRLEALARKADTEADEEANSPSYRRKQRYRAQRLRADICVLIRQAGGVQQELFKQLPTQVSGLMPISDAVRRKFKAPIARARKRRQNGATSP